MGSPFVSDITHHWNKWCQCWCLCRALSGSWREKMHLKSQHIWHLNSNHDIRIIYGIIGRCKTTLATIEWFKYLFPHVGYFYNPLICGWREIVIVTACTVVMAFWSLEHVKVIHWPMWRAAVGPMAVCADSRMFRACRPGWEDMGYYTCRWWFEVVFLWNK